MIRLCDRLRTPETRRRFVHRVRLAVGLVVSVGFVACRPAGPHRVLFIGNSFTYVHNVPEIWAALVEANGEERPEVRLIATGGATLTDHLADSVVHRALTTEHWDAVVIQEQSGLDNFFLVNGVQRIDDSPRFNAAAAELVELARAASPKIWLVSHWRGERAPERDAQALAYYIGRRAEALGTGVLPVGAAWEAARASVPAATLYYADSLHASQAGSWTYACVLYRALNGREPRQLPRQVTGTAIEFDEGTQLPDSTETLVDLDPQLARTLCDAANAAVEGATEPLAPPPPIEVPTLPAGDVPSLAAALGSWEGRMLLYPSAATVTFRFDRGGTGNLHVLLDSGAERDFTLDSVRVTADALEFRNPDGPNGSVMTFRGRAVGDSLVGIASFGQRGTPFFGIGTWRVGR